MVIIPKRLRIRHDPFICDGSAISSSLQPTSGHLDLLVVSESVEVWAKDPFWIKALVENDRARRVRYAYFVRRTFGHLLKPYLFEFKTKIAREYLVNRKDLVQPSDWCINSLLWPVLWRVISSKTDEDLSQGMALESWRDHFFEPGIALFERREDTHFRVGRVSPRINQCLLSFTSDLGTKLRRFTQARFYPNRLTCCHCRDDCFSEERPKAVNLGRKCLRLFEDCAGLLDISIVD